MEYKKILAHSKKRCGREQTYRDHLTGVEKWIRAILERWKGFLAESLYDRIGRILLLAKEFHDMGKLDEKNQKVLHEDVDSGSLPVPHPYAGIEFLLSKGNHMAAAALICGHHRPGLPDLNGEVSEDIPFCGTYKATNKEQKAFYRYTQDHRKQYLETHEAEMGRTVSIPDHAEKAASALEIRMMLSCLVNGDWNDTAGREPDGNEPEQRKRRQGLWEQYLKNLDIHVDSLSCKAEKEADQRTGARNALRQEVYRECREKFPITKDKDAEIYNVDAYVGTGKTTAVLALALRLAAERKLRHIFIIFPYISILNQALEVLKNAILSEDERERYEEIIEVIHCRAEYENRKLRSMADSWETPIILTTSVAFYETLASDRPGSLKKLQELPGSAIILDEFHASAPAECLPVIWQWLGELSRKWGCPVLLSSGTMVNFWDNQKFKDAYGKDYFPAVPRPVLSPELQEKMKAAEKERVHMQITQKDLEICQFAKISDLLDFVLSQKGPRIILVETRKAAAMIASELKLRGEWVFHLSNAFCPEDCGKILDKVKAALKRTKEEEKACDCGTGAYGCGTEVCDWTLVTTTYAGMGLELSFRSGFCQIFSCNVYLQLKGRMNRNYEYPDAPLWAFELSDTNLSENSEMEVPRDVLRAIFQDNLSNCFVESWTPSELASHAFQEEIKRMPGLMEKQLDLLHEERGFAFHKMAEKFKIIPDKDEKGEAVAIIDSKIAAAIRHGYPYDKAKMRNRSITIYKSLVESLGLKRLAEQEEFYELPPEKYDPELLGCFKMIVQREQ